jgi:hypothetical protein
MHAELYADFKTVEKLQKSLTKLSNTRKTFINCNKTGKRPFSYHFSGNMYF